MYHIVRIPLIFILIFFLTIFYPTVTQHFLLLETQSASLVIDTQPLFQNGFDTMFPCL